VVVVRCRIAADGVVARITQPDARVVALCGVVRDSAVLYTVPEIYPTRSHSGCTGDCEPAYSHIICIHLKDTVSGICRLNSNILPRRRPNGQFLIYIHIFGVCALMDDDGVAVANAGTVNGVLYGSPGVA